MTLSLSAFSAGDAPAVVAHLLRLDPVDRSLRFIAGVVGDEAIRRYVAGIPFERDALIGLRDDVGRVVALAHGCVYTVAGRLRIEAAFSVDAAWRRQGLGGRLMQALQQVADDVDAEALVAMCVARNLPMRRIFEQSGMRVTREADEVHAVHDAAAARQDASLPT